MREHGAIFRQSLRDFPCPVVLGKNTPSFGLHRFNKGLRFIPLDDEGFSLRGDKRRLLYKGRERSHRFTILGDTSFEYDCILERPPKSNVISLLIEGAENYDFFRQPDFVSEPFLKGSYAVYKKETLVGEGTGKLCHIHRPEIIDARGRRCWGDLSIVGNYLHITIPEQWLGEAAYPVIVDPTIGTTTVGSQFQYEEEPGNGLETLYIEMCIPVNRFLISEKIIGNCSAYFYVNEDDYDGGGRPVIYSENYSQPHLRKSSQESYINLRVTSSNPKGWRNGTFNINETLNAGSYIWFGMYTEYLWFPRFDYGGNFWNEWWENHNGIPNTYPFYKDKIQQASPYNFKLSMYFTYVNAQNYYRTITQGVKLADNRKLKINYKRNNKQTVKTTETAKGLPHFLRMIQETAQNISFNDRQKIIADYNRITQEEVTIVTNSKTMFFFFIMIKEKLNLLSLNIQRRFNFRSIDEFLSVNENLYHYRKIFRGLFDSAGIETEIKTGWLFSVKVADTVHAVGRVFRGLLIFIKILTTLLMRDYVIPRFLISKKEIKIKSLVTKDISLNSRFH